MSAEPAARLGDEIAHGFGLLAMVAGAVVGVAAGVAVVGAMTLTGGLAAVVIAGAVAGGGLAGGQLMDGLNTVFNLPEPTSGVIATGSPNVLTNFRPAVRAMLDVAGCSGLPFNHPPLPMPVPVAEGSATVLINGMPASRLKSKLMCGAHLKTGSQNVIIGGETARLGFVFDLEAWTKTGLKILGLGALIGGGLFAAWAGLAAFGLFAGTMVVGGAAFEGLGMIGDAIGPGYRDLLQGIAGLGLVAAGPKLARLGQPAKPPPEAVPEVVQVGGAYKDVKGIPGHEAHHMPANSVSPLSTGEGPSIAMPVEDHRMTASWGNSREARAYRKTQAELLEKGDFRGAQQMDIDDISGKFGNKYDGAIEQMIDYSQTKGYR
ncbi:MAG: PAAR domain-containing protein [Burkholderiales bacterium]|nr:PAAR domain-containing protein [Burkholderiales bacterium]